MPESKRKSDRKQGKGKTRKTAVSVDVLLAGPLLLVPEVQAGIIGGVEAFAPRNGHPIGAVFVPEVFFSDAELADPECARWPAASSFTLLDSHSYSIELQQKGQKGGGFRAAAIPETNHKVKPGRRLSGDWEISIAVRGQLSGWSSHRLMTVREGLFHGADRPTVEQVASLHRLTYEGVRELDFCGASGEARAYLKEQGGKGGSLIVIGEIPYQSSLGHERRAIEAMAKLAGLDLHLVETDPAAYRTRLMGHVINCGFSTILTE